MSDRGRLQINPLPLYTVPDAQREVWTRPEGWRCEHTDGRGRCTSRDTRTFWNATERRSEAFCERHAPTSGEPAA